MPGPASYELRRKQQMLDLLRDLEEYMDQRADADGDSEGYRGNEEMHLLVRIRQALGKAD